MTNTFHIYDWGKLLKWKYFSEREHSISCVKTYGLSSQKEYHSEYRNAASILNLGETLQYLSDTMLITTLSGLELITEQSC